MILLFYLMTYKNKECLFCKFNHVNGEVICHDIIEDYVYGYPDYLIDALFNYKTCENHHHLNLTLKNFLMGYDVGFEL